MAQTRKFHDVAYIPLSYVLNELHSYTACIAFIERHEELSLGFECMQNACYERDIAHALSIIQ